MPDPLPVIPLQYAEPARQGSPRWRRVIRVAHVLALLVCVVSVGMLVWYRSAEFVLVAGPLLATAGTVLLIGGVTTCDRRAAVLGAAHVAICLLFVLLVNLLSWGPREARVPFLIMGAVYTALAVAAWAWPARGPR